MFFCECGQIFKNMYVEKHMWKTASVNSRAAVFQKSLALPFKRNALTSAFHLKWNFSLAGTGLNWKPRIWSSIFAWEVFPNFGLKILVL